MNDTNNIYNLYMENYSPGSLDGELTIMLKEINNKIKQLQEGELMVTDEVEATAKLEVYEEMKEWLEAIIFNYVD